MKLSDARKAVKWFQKNIGLADWTIEVAISNSLPEWAGTLDEKEKHLGLCSTDAPYWKSRIWVNRDVHIEDDESDMLATLFHELLHGLFEDHEISACNRMEGLLNRLGDVLAARYREILRA